MEAVLRCVKAKWDSSTAPVCHATSCPLMEKVACLPMVQMQQQVIYPTSGADLCMNFEDKK